MHVNKWWHWLKVICMLFWDTLLDCSLWDWFVVVDADQLDTFDNWLKLAKCIKSINCSKFIRISNSYNETKIIIHTTKSSPDNKERLLILLINDKTIIIILIIIISQIIHLIKNPTNILYMDLYIKYNNYKNNKTKTNNSK